MRKDWFCASLTVDPLRIGLYGSPTRGQTPRFTIVVSSSVHRGGSRPALASEASTQWEFPSLSTGRTRLPYSRGRRRNGFLGLSLTILGDPW